MLCHIRALAATVEHYSNAAQLLWTGGVECGRLGCLQENGIAAISPQCGGGRWLEYTGNPVANETMVDVPPPVLAPVDDGFGSSVVGFWLVQMLP